MDSNIFKKRLDQLGIGRQVTAATVVVQAQQTIHDKFGSHGDENLRVVSFRNGVLKIASTSSAWSAECRGIIPDLQTGPVKRVVFVLSHQDFDE